VGGWTNCAAEAANGEVQNESEDFLVDAGHKLCHAEEEGGDADAANHLGPNKGNMPPATTEWGPSFQLKWGANAVLPGKFGDGDISPTDDSGEYLYKWVTFGGQNSRFNDIAAGNGNWAEDWEATAEQDILDAGGTGCAFDEEGGVDVEDVEGKTSKFIKNMRKKHKNWTFLYVPTCGGTINKYDPENGGPDYVAPMMYNTNHNSYPAMDLSVKPASNFIVDCITMIHRAGWPPARTILTYQSFDSYRVKDDSNLPFLLGQLLGNHSLTLPRGEVLRGPYAGVLGWPAQCGAGDGRCWPEVDRINTEAVRAGMKESNNYKEVKDETLTMTPEEKMKKAADQEMARWTDGSAGPAAAPAQAAQQQAAAPKEQQAAEAEEAPKQEQAAPTKTKQQEQEQEQERRQRTLDEAILAKETEKERVATAAADAIEAAKAAEDAVVAAAEEAAARDEAAQKQEQERAAYVGGGALEEANKAAADAAEAAKKALEDAANAMGNNGGVPPMSDVMKDAMAVEEERHAAAANLPPAGTEADVAEPEPEAPPQEQEAPQQQGAQQEGQAAPEEEEAPQEQAAPVDIIGDANARCGRCGCRHQGARRRGGLRGQDGRGCGRQSERGEGSAR